MNRLCWLLLAGLLVGPTEVLGQSVSTPVTGRTFVLIANGAGGYTTLFDNLREAYNTRLLIQRRPCIFHIPWATEGENLSDYRESYRHLAGAFRMAGEVQRIRKFAPDSRIVLMGYSAGASVVLVAAEQLPPNSVERIILFGPTVSTKYDVRRALCASRLGIVSFNSSRDSFLESLEETIGAPYEWPGTRVASTAGFWIADPRCRLSNDPLLARLRQYNCIDLRNGHFGTVTVPFLREHVIPLIPPPALTRPAK